MQSYTEGICRAILREYAEGIYRVILRELY